MPLRVVLDQAPGRGSVHQFDRADDGFDGGDGGAEEVEFGDRPVHPVRHVTDREVGEDAAKGQVLGFGDQACQFGGVSRFAPNAPHARVDLEVDVGDPAQTGGSLFGLVIVSAPTTARSMSAGKRGPSSSGKHCESFSTGRGDARFAQSKPLRNRGDTQPVGCAGALDHASDLHGVMPIAVGLHGDEHLRSAPPLAFWRLRRMADRLVTAWVAYSTEQSFHLSLHRLLRAHRHGLTTFDGE